MKTCSQIRTLYIYTYIHCCRSFLNFKTVFRCCFKMSQNTQHYPKAVTIWGCIYFGVYFWGHFLIKIHKRWPQTWLELLLTTIVGNICPTKDTPNMAPQMDKTTTNYNFWYQNDPPKDPKMDPTKRYSRTTPKKLLLTTISGAISQ